MSDQDALLDEPVEEAGDQAAEPDDFLIDLLSGNKEKASSKRKLVQRVLRLLIDSYGFDRADLETDYRHGVKGCKPAKIDVAVFRPNTEHVNANLQRVVVCQPQKKRDKLRSFEEAKSDLAPLEALMEALPNASLGMWTSGQEEFLLQAERSRFEVKKEPLGVWPVPGEYTAAAGATGGPIQISADAEDLEDSLMRCRQYLNRNLGLDSKDCFKQLAVLLFAKIHDETLPLGDRQFWVTGDEPFTAEGQSLIDARIRLAIDAAKRSQPSLLASGWDLTLAPNQVARVATELARYSFSETQPRHRTQAFRAIARSVMDGREGRYPTPLNVAQLAVEMIAPRADEKVMDCSSGTGTFLAMAAAHVFERTLKAAGTTPDEATPKQLRAAQSEVATWAASHAFGCDIDPFLAVTSRMNLLFTVGNPGQVFRIDARTFPDGDLDGVAAAQSAIPLGSMDIVLVNPWFTTKDKVSDTAILERFELGHTWAPDGSGGYRNLGDIASAGVPPEVLFIERALQWAKPGTGRVAILLPDGLLGNPSDEYIRWWILRHTEVLASVDLPVEPFKDTVKEYGLTPALPSLLVLRRRGPEELLHTQHPEYSVFMAVVDRAGVDARGNILFQRAPDGEEIVFDDEVVERVRTGSTVTIRRVTRRDRRVHDELPLVAEKYREFVMTGEVTP